jgi:hypothetical protein
MSRVVSELPSFTAMISNGPISRQMGMSVSKNAGNPASSFIIGTTILIMVLPGCYDFPGMTIGKVPDRILACERNR